MLNIQLDLQQFEQKYQQSTETFYQQFMDGKLDDTEDFIVWAGIYEMLLDNKRQLKSARQC
jgi:spore coat polysaccharide biosynthesis protein SpsF (cytidylyltransferase family)